MSDDVFSHFFELFDEPGPVNLKLATEVCHHLIPDAEPVDPWGAEEFRDLTRLAEYQMERVTPFPIEPATDVLPVDIRGWTDVNMKGFIYLAEPFGRMIDPSSLGPAAQMAGMISSTIVGIQLGTLVGSLGRWVMAGFDAGVPVRDVDQISYVATTIDKFATNHRFSPKDIRLWAALNEVTHRAMFRVPFAIDHLLNLIGGYADAIRITPDQFGGLMEGFDPTNPPEIDTERLVAMFETPEAQAAEAELTAFLAVATAYRRILVGKAAKELIPHLDDIDSARDAERDLGSEADASPLTATFLEGPRIQEGIQFCREIESRFGPEAFIKVWKHPNSLPLASEMGDPVGWAARVLLDDFE